VPEGLSPTEVGKEIGEHAKHTGGHSPHDRAIAIGEALLLSVVTIVAAWSGYSAAKWGTESSLGLAAASSTRTEANREFQESLTYRVGDATTFNAWFAAYLAEDEEAVEVAMAATLWADHTDLLKWNQRMIERKNAQVRQMLTLLSGVGSTPSSFLYAS